MSDDFRVAATFRDHPKFRRLEATLGEPGVLAVITLWGAVRSFHSDGTIPADEVETLARWRGEPGALLRMLTELQFLDKVRAHRPRTVPELRVHSWETHNGYAASAMRRSEIARQAANSRWMRRHAGALPGAMLNDARSNAPDPDPDPDLKIPPTPHADPMLEHCSEHPAEPNNPPPTPPDKRGGSPILDSTARTRRTRPRRASATKTSTSRTTPTDEAPDHRSAAADPEPSRDHSIIAAQDEGADAHRAGLARNTNPIQPEDDAEYQAWLRGWDWREQVKPRAEQRAEPEPPPRPRTHHNPESQTVYQEGFAQVRAMLHQAADTEVTDEPDDSNPFESESTP